MTVSKNVVIFVVLVLCCFGQYMWGAQSSFQVKVPYRHSFGEAPIRTIEVYVRVQQPGPAIVNFEIVQHGGAMLPFSVSTTAGSSDSAFFPLIGVDPLPDEVYIEALDPGVPGVSAERFVIIVYLDSNWTGCYDGTPQGGEETWEFEVTNTQFEAACVSSFEPFGITCEESLLIPPGSHPAEIIGFPHTGIGCGSDYERPAVDVMLVLDKSGSMSSTITSTATSRMAELHIAVQNFVEIWNDLKTYEGGLVDFTLLNGADRIGVVTFDTIAQDWTPAPLIAGLNDFNTVWSTINSQVTTIPAGGSTTIGSGLETAAGHFTLGDDKRHAILLMSDGWQNTERMAGVATDTTDLDGDGDTTDTIVITNNYANTDPQPLPGQDSLNIWTVSVGDSASDINDTIFTQIADTGKGFNINVPGVNVGDLKLYFLELLQNFLRFNTYQTTRLISDEIALCQVDDWSFGCSEFGVYASSTAKVVTFSLMWNQKEGENMFSMKVIPPVGDPIDSQYFKTGPGFIHMTVPLPLPSPYVKGSHSGEWTVLLGARSTGQHTKIPYQFFAMLNDDVVHSTFEVEKRDYVTGDPIPLRVRLKEFAHPIINPNGDLKVVATLIKPKEGIGNLLAESSVSGTPPDPGDPLTPTERKLLGLLQEDPGKIKRTSEIITLYDDGKSVHGDAKANDGIYSNLYTQTQKQGNYNFLFAVEGPTRYTGLISRQHIETVYVRLRPDTDNSGLESEVTGSGEGRKVNFKFTPRDKFGNWFGPGYKNQFIVNTTSGIWVKLRDPDLKGVYEGVFGAPGDGPVPQFTIWYVKPFMRVTDEMDPEKIPGDLLEPVVEDHTPGGRPGKVRGVYLSLHGGFCRPHPDLNEFYDGKFSLAVDLEFELSKNISVLLFGGYNRFESTSADVLKIFNSSLNGKLYLWSSGNLRFFVNGGIGFYWINPGNNNLGFNLGSGLQLRVNQQIALETWYNYHNVWTSGTATKFSTFLAGFNIRL